MAIRAAKETTLLLNRWLKTTVVSVPRNTLYSRCTEDQACEISTNRAKEIFKHDNLFSNFAVYTKETTGYPWQILNNTH